MLFFSWRKTHALSQMTQIALMPCLIESQKSDSLLHFILSLSLSVQAGSVSAAITPSQVLLRWLNEPLSHMSILPLSNGCLATALMLSPEHIF